MKTRSLIQFAISLVLFSNLYGQDSSVKNFDRTSKLGGDVTIINSSIKIVNDNTYRVFEIDAPDDGDYYFCCWIMAAYRQDGSIYYDVQINDSKDIERISLDIDNWQNAYIKDKLSNQKSLKLKKGINTISIISEAPEVPMVEYVVLSKDKAKAIISDKSYQDYIYKLKMNKLPSNYAEIKKAAIEAEISGSSLKSYKLSNPAGNYDHEMELDFNYSFYIDMYLDPSAQIVLETKNATVDPVLQLFNLRDPIAYGSWTDDDGALDGYNSKINTRVAYTSGQVGFYRVFIRAFSGSSTSVPGTTDLYLNGRLYASNCPVAGSRILCSKTVSEELNYFTSFVTGDTYILIEDQTTSPGLIVASNDDYSTTSPHDFVWGKASRVKQNFNRAIASAIVTSGSSSSPTGKCDLYMNCKNFNVNSSPFPNLKANDAIQSAPPSDWYFCISWTGGVTNYPYWPPEKIYGANYYVAGNPLASFDNFYGNTPDVRYVGAMTYTRTGATDSNSIVDLWRASNGEYKHASVTKPGNNMPHGYAWESKLGCYWRIFHPRYALNGSLYGSVSDYYIPTSLKSTMFLDESIARGLSVIENVELSEAEKDTVSQSINAMTNDQKDEFESKYNAWKLTWEKPEISMQSNPRMYAKSKEYNDLIDFCKVLGKTSWPLVFNKIQLNDVPFTINLLIDLTLPENDSVLDKVTKESNLKSATASGAYIVSTPQSYAMRYIKALLKSTKDINAVDDKCITYSNSFKFVIFPNPVNSTSQISFDLEEDSKVSAQVIDLNGRELSVIINRQILKAGNYNYKLNIPANYQGSYLVKLWVNNKVNVKLITVK